MLHICPRLPNQTFDELPFEEEILGFLRYLGHSGEIKKITDVNINKLHQPWRSFAAGINKCLCGKNFVYQVEHKDSKKRNEIYYPRFTKVIINFFLTKDPSIPRRNKVNWHYVRDDQMFTTIKLDLLNFGSLFGFDHRLKTLEANFSKFVQTNLFVGAVSSILGIVERYMDQWMNEAVKVAVQIQSDRLRVEAQAKNEEFLNKLDENIQKIIKEQVK
nr:hypothetical protein [Tanacetum cinerariifolium]